MSADTVRAWVETLIERLTDTDKAVPDGDGDYPFRLGDASYYVRILQSYNVLVQIFSVAVDKVDMSPELAIDLNDINTKLWFGRAVWVGNQILFEAELFGESIDQAAFDACTREIAGATENFGPELARRHSGQLRFFESQTEGYVHPTQLKFGFQT